LEYAGCTSIDKTDIFKLYTKTMKKKDFDKDQAKQKLFDEACFKYPRVGIQ
jgi:hypothetical protein